MTESEWLECADPMDMLAFVRDKASDRKVWLFACGSYRRLLRIRAGEREWSAVEVVERFADGLASQEDLGPLTTTGTSVGIGPIPECDFPPVVRSR